MNGLHFAAVNWPLAASALTSRIEQSKDAEAADHRDDERSDVRALGPGASNSTLASALIVSPPVAGTTR